MPAPPEMENRRFLGVPPGPRCLVRYATTDDAASVLEITSLLRAEGGFFVTEVDEGLETVEMVAQGIGELMDQPGGVVLVAQVDDQVVGFLELEPGKRRRIAHVAAMSIKIRQEWRRMGIGRGLMETFLSWAKTDETIEKVSLAVMATNQGAIAFYRSLGFVEEGRRPREIKLGPGQYVDDILMYRFVTE